MQTDNTQSSSVGVTQPPLTGLGEPPNKVPRLPAYASHFTAPVATFAAPTNAQPSALTPDAVTGTQQGSLPVPAAAPSIINPGQSSVTPPSIAADIAAAEVRAAQATAAARNAVSEAKAAEAAANQKAAAIAAKAEEAVSAALDTAQQANKGVSQMQNIVNEQQATIQAGNEKIRLQEQERARLAEAADAERLQRIHDRATQDDELQRARDTMDDTVRKLARELRSNICL